MCLWKDESFKVASHRSYRKGMGRGGPGDRVPGGGRAGACDDEVQEGLRFSSKPLAPCVREAGGSWAGVGETREVTPIRNQTQRLTVSGEGK